MKSSSGECRDASFQFLVGRGSSQASPSATSPSPNHAPTEYAPTEMFLPAARFKPGEATDASGN
jgi:hypothetical protein